MPLACYLVIAPESTCALIQSMGGGGMNGCLTVGDGEGCVNGACLRENVAWHFQMLYL